MRMLFERSQREPNLMHAGPNAGTRHGLAAAAKAARLHFDSQDGSPTDLQSPQAVVQALEPIQGGHRLVRSYAADTTTPTCAFVTNNGCLAPLPC